MYTYRKHIAFTYSKELREYSPEHQKLVLDYCEEYIAQYRQENPVRTNLPHIKYFWLMAINKFGQKQALL